jgi:hypothetical protein
VVQKSLEASDETIGVLAREWRALDGIRGLLERGGVAFQLHHREFHRPLHRRYPSDRIVRHLWNNPATVQGSARELVESLLTKWQRPLDDPPAAQLLQLVDEIDEERRRSVPKPTKAADPNRPVPSARAEYDWSPIDTRELADALLMASRDAARRNGACSTERVHLCTFHGAKGLEFDKVLVLPYRPAAAPGGDPDEERRTYYVAMTRARHELVLATFAHAGELALQVHSPEVDLRARLERLEGTEAGYLDCDPRDVVLRSVELGRAQAAISRLREGMPLSIVETSAAPVLRSVPSAEQSVGDEFVGKLSERGRKRFEVLKDRCGGAARARVHEIFVHLQRDSEGRIVRRSLVVLPTIIVEGS